jgi:hypothetical protein
MPSWASRSPKSFLFSAGIRKLLKTHYHALADAPSIAGADRS